jgi:hypothetical protein
MSKLDKDRRRKLHHFLQLRVQSLDLQELAKLLKTAADLADAAGTVVAPVNEEGTCDTSQSATCVNEVREGKRSLTIGLGPLHAAGATVDPEVDGGLECSLSVLDFLVTG